MLDICSSASDLKDLHALWRFFARTNEGLPPLQPENAQGVDSTPQAALARRLPGKLSYPAFVVALLGTQGLTHTEIATAHESAAQISGLPVGIAEERAQSAGDRQSHRHGHDEGNVTPSAPRAAWSESEVSARVDSLAQGVKVGIGNLLPVVDACAGGQTDPRVGTSATSASWSAAPTACQDCPDYKDVRSHEARQQIRLRADAERRGSAALRAMLEGWTANGTMPQRKEYRLWRLVAHAEHMQANVSTARRGSWAHSCRCCARRGTVEWLCCHGCSGSLMSTR